MDTQMRIQTGDSYAHQVTPVCHQPPRCPQCPACACSNVLRLNHTARDTFLGGTVNDSEDRKQVLRACS